MEDNLQQLTGKVIESASQQLPDNTLTIVFTDGTKLVCEPVGDDMTYLIVEIIKNDK